MKNELRIKNYGKTITILTIIFIFFFTLKQPLYAITVHSNTLTICVGINSVECAKQTSNNPLLKAAQTIKAAYDQCSNGHTSSISQTTKDCLSKYLTSNSYSNDQVNYFIENLKHHFVGCGVQCLGFVEAAVNLVTKTQARGFLQQGTPLQILSHRQNQYNSDGIIYNLVDSPQPGDIGLTAPYMDKRNNGGPAGHALIVKSVESNVIFTAVESNWDNHCGLSDKVKHPSNSYYFYRMQ